MPHIISGEVDEFICRRPRPAEARRLAQRATQLAEANDLIGAIDLIEKAIRLDQSGALEGYQALRGEMYASLGRYKPARATRLYDFGWLLSRKGFYDEAEMAYLAANALDPGFLWPLNNLAWMRATNKDVGARDGQKALACATDACARSDWNSWSFLGTLAAAYAETKDFESAIRWQRRAQQIAPQEHSQVEERRLQAFAAGAAYIDLDDPVAAGGSLDSGWLARISVDTLLKEIDKLRDDRLHPDNPIIPIPRCAMAAGSNNAS